MQDGELFKRIVSWEKDHFAKLAPADRTSYLGSLRNQAAELKAAKDKILIRQANEMRIWRHNADIAQLNWRAKYLTSLNASLN